MILEETIKKGYLLHFSNGSDIKIDEDEIQKVFSGIATGNIVVVKQGAFNPSYFVNLTIDDDRMARLYDEVKRNQYWIEKGERKYPQLTPLENILENIKGLPKPQTQNLLK